MILRSMRNGFFSAIFLALLVLGGFSLVLTDWNGMFRGGGITKTDVAVVDGTPIKITEFNRTVDRVLRQQRVSPQQAYEMGLITNILQSEVLRRILDNSAINYGINVNNKYVAEQVQQLISPLVTDQTNEKQALSQFLQMQGLNEKTLVHVIRSELQTSILKTSIGAADYIPAKLAQDIEDYRSISKKIRYIELPDTDIKLEKKADDKTLETFYKTVERQYMMPEKRDFKIAVLDTTPLVKSISISDEDIQSYYNEHKQDYAEPEQRTLEQAILNTKSDALKVKENVEKGMPFKKAIETVTGNDKAYVAANNFAETDLTSNMSVPVFTANEGDYVGPIQSALGYHIIKVSKIVEPHIQPLEQVKVEIKKMLVDNEAGDKIYSVTSEIEDRLAGGDTFEMLAKDYKLKISTVSAASAAEKDLKVGDMTLDAEQQQAILKRVFEAGENEPTTLADLSSNQLFSVDVTKVTASAPKPFAEVKDTIAKRWTETQQARQNLAKAQAIMTDLNDGKTTLDKTGFKTVTVTLSRKADDNKNIPEEINNPRIIGRFMETPKDKFILNIPVNARSIIIGEVLDTKMDTNNKPDTRVTQTLESDTGTANLMLLVSYLQKEHPVTINNDLIKRVYGTSPEDQ